MENREDIAIDVCDYLAMSIGEREEIRKEYIGIEQLF